jgi:peptidyl-prolyl cis-trans isomerase C
MKTKTKMIFSAALAAALIALPRAQAATGGNAATNALAEAGATSAATNASPANVMASLFGDPVIAKGKDFEIKQSQLDGGTDAIKARAAAQGQMIPPEDLPKVTVSVLSSLIANQILLQQATEADKASGKKEADQYVDQAIKRYGSQATVETMLKASGKTFADWRTDITQQATASAVLTRELNAAPTDADIKKYYADNPTYFDLPEQAHVRHILLAIVDLTSPTRTPLPDTQVKAKRKQIDDILKRARAGEDFAKLAKEFSDDVGTKDDGGDLPPFARASVDPQRAMVPEFEAAAFSLTNNQISDVITTQYGYHIIQMIDKTPARKLALTDKVPSSEVTVADYVKDRLTGQTLKEKAPAYIEKLIQAPGVEILDPALKALMAAQTNAPAATPTAAKP